MAKASKAKNGTNKEYTVKHAPGGEKAPAVSGKHKAGDSRSKSMMKNITPSKGY